MPAPVSADDADLDLGGLLLAVLAAGDDGELRAPLTSGSELPGARLNLRLVGAFAAAVGDHVGRPGDAVDDVDRRRPLRPPSGGGRRRSPSR